MLRMSDRLSMLQHLRDTEVSNLKRAIAGNEDVLWFEVSVNDLQLVDMMQSETYHCKIPEDFTLIIFILALL